MERRNGAQSLKLGVKAGEKVSIEIDMELSSDSAINAHMNFQCNETYVSKNEAGQDIITGEDAVEKVFTEARSNSDRYGSPVYFAEFCVMSNYINDYTNYRDYTDCFVEYLDEYRAGWVWHCMSERTGVTNDNGYGAYLDTIIPDPDKKNVGFDYVIPKLLSAQSVIVNPDPPTETDDSGSGAITETDDKEKSYVWLYVLCGGVAVVAVGAIAFIVLKKPKANVENRKDKNKK